MPKTAFLWSPVAVSSAWSLRVFFGRWDLKNWNPTVPLRCLSKPSVVILIGHKVAVHSGVGKRCKWDAFMGSSSMCSLNGHLLQGTFQVPRSLEMFRNSAWGQSHRAIYSVLSWCCTDQRIYEHFLLADGWQSVLIELVDPSQLPAYWGGELVGPDGNTKCSHKVGSRKGKLL